MSYIDIRDFNENTMFRSIVVSKHRHINLILIYKTKLNKFLIYRQDFKIMRDDYTLTELQNIDVVKQKTGFGYKKFFKCPYCGKRRQHLYFVEDELKFACRSCIDSNVYRYRTNLYDRDIKNIIEYKTVKLLKFLKADTIDICMRDLISNIPDRPRYMREETYALAVKRLYFLHWMWKRCILIKDGPAVGINSQLDLFSVRDINDMLEKDNVNFVYEHFLFPEYHEEAYRVLKEIDNIDL